MPTTFHLYCLHHLDTNVTGKLRSTLSQVWDQFRRDFWTVYRAVSPEDFDRLWKNLTSTYPAAQPYLEDEIYSCRQHWAWAWVGSTFTAGVRTTGRVESENRVNKIIGGPKKTLLQLFRGLNERTNDQKVQDLILITAMREHAGPYANQKCRREMEESVFYTAEAVQLPSGKRQWRSMINVHENDRAYISTRWLIHQIVQRGLQVKHLIRITHRAVHYLALLRDGRYLCDCCMDQNLGPVCRHYFLAWVTIQDLPFHISFIRSR
ncbi:hypothetical protein B0H13DRAFT_1600266 [Mycena leptocephala]|nr:hypothetical protein B0H13DRAFT_1600266 [Mycena leptocephala]